MPAAAPSTEDCAAAAPLAALALLSDSRSCPLATAATAAAAVIASREASRAALAHASPFGGMPCSSIGTHRSEIDLIVQRACGSPKCDACAMLGQVAYPEV